jgi:hypothetical protein
MKEQLIYLGFLIKQEGMNMDPKKVKAIMESPFPRNVFKVIRFNGLASLYKIFINCFSDICAPMVESIRKDKKHFKWKTTIEKLFQFLEKRITEQMILALPVFNELFHVKCDASEMVVGNVLSWDDKPITYFS